jgi:hypothetical protein
MVMNINSTKSIQDGLVMGASLSISDLIVSNVFKGFSLPYIHKVETQQYINQFILSPIVSALIYDYLYNSYYQSKFSNNNLDSHSKNEIYIIAYLTSVLTDFLKSPLLSLLNVKLI